MIARSARRAALPAEAAAKAAAPKPRTKPAEVRREELMDAAERLFLEKGVGAASVDEIVATAGVAKGTFYLHFASKDHLLAALQQRFVTSFADLIQAAMDRRPAEDWRGRLRAWAAAGVNGYLDRVALHDVVFHEVQVSDRGLKHENVVVSRLAAFLGQGARAGAWPVAEPHLIAVMLFSALHGAVDDVLGAGAAVDRKRLIRTLDAFCLRAVTAADAPSR
jgi:AcrR family transcriptional regulator